MDLRRSLLLAVLVILLIATCIEADFLYNRNTKFLEAGQICLPGHTIVTWNKEKMKLKGPKFEKDEEKHEQVNDEGQQAEDGKEKEKEIDEEKEQGHDKEKDKEAKVQRKNRNPHITANNILRYHMNFHMETDCKMCVCSLDGKDQYCSIRPAMNVNECMVVETAIQGGPEKLDTTEKIGPFQKERVLSLLIRRDLIWHDDEIPYAPKAKCRRGRSYYSNSVHANDTDIDVGPDVNSLLSYSNLDVCFFCVCGMDGESVGCIHRDPWYCDYYRYLETENAVRDTYTNLFERDVPSYFRTLSYRLRRSMDRGTIDLLEAGGDTLCCGHPNGHRRAIHSKVRSRLRSFKKQKLQKENLMKGHDGDQGDYEDFMVNND